MDDDDGSYDENVQERFIIQFEVTVQLISKISFSPRQGVFYPYFPRQSEVDFINGRVVALAKK